MAVICLLTTGFHALAGGFVVECKDSDGTSHLEWGGCGGDEPSHCMKPCGPGQPVNPESEPSEPCDDTPIKSDECTATRRSGYSFTTIDLVLPTFAVSSCSIDLPPLKVLVRRIEFRAAAPPPAIACIRTIVMLV
jgi:hypothetical protein